MKPTARYLGSPHPGGAEAFRDAMATRGIVVEHDDFWRHAAEDYNGRPAPEGQEIGQAAAMDWAVLDPADAGVAAGW